VALLFARNLQVNPDFSQLLPADYPSVQTLERIRTTIGAGETSVDLAIESPSFEDNLAFAEALVPVALQLMDPRSREPYFVRAELHRDIRFLENNGLYFATEAELDALETYLEEEIYDAKLEANPLFFSLDDEEEEEPEDVEEMRASIEHIIGSEYHLSPDSTVLVVRFFVGGSSTNITYIEALYRDLATLIDAHRLGGLETTLAGRLWRQRVEVRAITDDVVGSLGWGLLFVLLTVVSYFFYKACQGRRLTGRIWLSEAIRTPVTALLIGVPLFMSLLWTAAVAYLAFGTLNLLSSTLGLVLFGLGIDYGIHFYARYVEERRHGHAANVAAQRTFQSTGQAIAMGAFTTAAPLYLLLVADFKGFSQFGAIAGTGVLFALAATLFVTPALLILCERVRLLQLSDRPSVTRSVPARFPAARSILVGGTLACIMALLLAHKVSFEYRFDQLEPTYPEWTTVNTKINEAFKTSDRRNPAYIVADNPAEVPGLVATIRESIERDTTLHVVDADSFRSTIRTVESLQERFPMDPDAQQRKLERIAFIRDSLLTDPVISLNASEDMDRLRSAAQTRIAIRLEEVPDFLRQQFTTKSGELGTFVTVFPAIGLSDGRKSIAFADDIGTITTSDGKTYHAGSPSIVAADMLRLMRQEAPYMMLATAFLVFFLLWLNFGRLRWALLAMLPLMAGILWMLLCMELFGMRLNFYNLAILPAIIGIGNDAGAHMVHRYREEGRGSILAVLRSTGEHVSIGALTTMVGFAGLLLSFHPGLQTIGSLAVTGIGTTLLAALLFLPAIIQSTESGT